MWQVTNKKYKKKNQERYFKLWYDREILILSGCMLIKKRILAIKLLKLLEMTTKF